MFIHFPMHIPKLRINPISQCMPLNLLVGLTFENSNLIQPWPSITLGLLAISLCIGYTLAYYPELLYPEWWPATITWNLAVIKSLRPGWVGTFIVRIVLFFIQYKTQKFYVYWINSSQYVGCMRVWLSMAFNVTKHGYWCPSPAGVYWVSDGTGINFVEYMRYKSVCFYNSLE